MKVGQIGPTFLVPEKTVNFFGVKHVVPSSTLKMRKSHKKLARVYAYTHAYTQIRDGGGKYAPPPSNNRVNSHSVEGIPACFVSVITFIGLLHFSHFPLQLERIFSSL